MTELKKLKFQLDSAPQQVDQYGRLPFLLVNSTGRCNTMTAPGARSAGHEATTSDLLHRSTEGDDVGSLEQ
ncbi:hypothetical protein, partial [Delftia tsuruhatensis]|uniref:hypothetical protein n=1 Tax=Delftia tsuruhatensis TaxID=180282 RepID=UPI001CB90C4B